MNIYKIVTFDGWNSKQFICSGFDLIQAIQNNYQIINNQVIRAELIGNENEEVLNVRV